MLTLRQLVGMPEEQRASVDIAEIHFACAEGLPGAEGLDSPALLHRLDDWAREVRGATARLAQHFERNPDAFRASPPFVHLTVYVTNLPGPFRVSASHIPILPPPD